MVATSLDASGGVGAVNAFDPYPIIDVDRELGDDPVEREEPLGTKRKFWFRRQGVDRWLFKFCRPGTGEDWAERISADLAARLSMPHAEVELATFAGESGVVVRDFTLGGSQALVHGNELLSELDPTYSRSDFFRVRKHTVESIVRALGELWYTPDESLPGEVDDPVGMFTGYLMLDALIGNTDRHHENWGVLVIAELKDGGRLGVVAPTYDHASSLGRELSDEARRRKYALPNGEYDVEKFVRKARSAIYAASTDAAPLSPIAAFRAFAQERPAAARAWLDRLAALAPDDVRASVDAVPSRTMSAPERQFAHGILACTRLQLLETEHG